MAETKYREVTKEKYQFGGIKYQNSEQWQWCLFNYI
jgi:hypothetical protein